MSVEMKWDSDNIKNYSAEDIRRYWNNQMSPAEMHALEKAAMDDPFLADALEGFSKLQNDPANDLALLRSKLNARTAIAAVVPMKKNYGWLKVAAAIIIIGGVGLLTFNIVSDHDNELAQKVLRDSIHGTAAPSEQPAANDSAQVPTAPSLGVVSDKPNSNPAAERRTVVRNHVKNSAIKVDSAKYNYNTEINLAKEEKQIAGEPTASAAPARKDIDDRGRAADGGLVKPKAQQYDAFQKSEAPSPPVLNNFSGKVIDVQNRGVANAVVIMNNSRQGTFTDHNGFFQLQSKDTFADIYIRLKGYQDVNLRLNSNQSSLITMDKDTPGELKEASEYSANAPKKKQFENKDLKVYVMDAEPAIGWEKYNQYIDSNKRVPQNQTPQKGEVVLSFKVNKGGELSAFTIEQSLNKAYDNEAIRLVKEGPAWKVTKGRKAKVKLIVHF